jgi:hypothetical protein
VSDDDFRFEDGQEVSWRVLDPDGNVVDEGIGRIELEMVTQMGEGTGDGSD